MFFGWVARARVRPIVSGAEQAGVCGRRRVAAPLTPACACCRPDSFLFFLQLLAFLFFTGGETLDSNTAQETLCLWSGLTLFLKLVTLFATKRERASGVRRAGESSFAPPPTTRIARALITRANQALSATSGPPANARSRSLALIARLMPRSPRCGPSARARRRMRRHKDFCLREGERDPHSSNNTKASLSGSQSSRSPTSYPSTP